MAEYPNVVSEWEAGLDRLRVVKTARGHTLEVLAWNPEGCTDRWRIEQLAQHVAHLVRRLEDSKRDIDCARAANNFHGDKARIVQLESALAAAQKERDEAKERIAGLEKPRSIPPGYPTITTLFGRDAAEWDDLLVAIQKRTPLNGKLREMFEDALKRATLPSPAPGGMPTWENMRDRYMMTMLRDAPFDDIVAQRDSAWMDVHAWLSSRLTGLLPSDAQSARDKAALDLLGDEYRMAEVPGGLVFNNLGGKVRDALIATGRLQEPRT